MTSGPGTRRRRALTAGVAGATALALASGLSLAGSSGAAESTPAPGVTAAGGTWHTMNAGGLARSYVLAVPAGPARRRPLLVVLHGLAQHTGPFLRGTGLVGAANAAGIAVVAPETPDGSWNDGRFGPGGRDDDAFILALVDHLVATGVADRSRVTLTGFSNGAGMSMELIARHPARFAALVSVGGTLLDAPGAPRPSAPIDAVFLHGDGDVTQPWLGRARRGPRLPAQLGEPATVATFRAVDGVMGPPAVTVLPRRPGAVTGPVTRYAWSGAGAGPGVTLYRIAGGAHAWPGLAPHARPGTQPGDVDATTVVVATAAVADLVRPGPHPE